MSFWMVNYVCSLVLWDNLVCVFYVFFFIFHFTRRPMSFMSLWTHALGVNLDAPEIAVTFFSKKQHGLLNLLCFCVVRVTSDRKCLWQYQLEWKMGEGLNHLTERRKIYIESCLLISHPRHELPCHFVDGRLKTLLRAWASRVPCWLSIKIFHDCRRCNDVVCMVKALPALETQIRSTFDTCVRNPHRPPMLSVEISCGSYRDSLNTFELSSMPQLATGEAAHALWAAWWWFAFSQDPSCTSLLSSLKEWKS